ncbi:hypothetical protein HYY72_05550 [Candidatus Woesearchaeota archaeon]|nr:hypothetical protein [Candidatus Woesearchaeota archaeon]
MMLKKRGFQEKAQVATEYMIVSAFVLMIILPAMYFFYTFGDTTQKQISNDQITKIGRDIVNNAESIYYLGYPSQMVIDEQMPANVEDFSIYRDWNGNLNEIRFKLSNGLEYNEVSFKSRVNILGYFDKPSHAQGAKSIRLAASYNKSGAPYVLIAVGGNCLISTNYDVNLDKSVDSLDYDQCKLCAGTSPLSDTCKFCDYNGNCEVEWQDLAMWKTLTTGSTHPTASISGPENAAINQPYSYTASAMDVDSNLASIKIYLKEPDGNIQQILPTCSFSQAQSSSCTVSWTPAYAGVYHVFPVAEDDAGLQCTGNPSGLNDGVVDCGFDDYMAVYASSPPP